MTYDTTEVERAVTLIYNKGANLKALKPIESQYKHWRRNMGQVP